CSSFGVQRVLEQIDSIHKQHLRDEERERLAKEAEEKELLDKEIDRLARLEHINEEKKRLEREVEEAKKLQEEIKLKEHVAQGSLSEEQDDTNGDLKVSDDHEIPSAKIILDDPHQSKQHTSE
ncbi:MAG: hypothetical protein ACC656_15625, partial [Candidatus Heimdallarchaeota archaeon]